MVTLSFIISMKPSSLGNLNIALVRNYQPGLEFCSSKYDFLQDFSMSVYSIYLVFLKISLA